MKNLAVKKQNDQKHASKTYKINAFNPKFCFHDDGNLFYKDHKDAKYVCNESF
jgi:hypothetical protein